MILYAVRKANVWILVWIYACSFGIELVADNQLAQYFADTFGKPIHEAGQIAATFGMTALVVRPLGGWISDVVARKLGMRGRLWNLWVSVFLGGVFGMLMARQEHDLTATIGLLVAYSFFTIYATGSCYAITPFISRRALGVVSGLIGAGGNAGAGLWQGVYFTRGHWSLSDGLFYLSVTQMAGSFALFLMYFPMWGGCLFPARGAATVERYYLSEFTADEIRGGQATTALKFAEEASYHSNPAWTLGLGKRFLRSGGGAAAEGGDESVDGGSAHAHANASAHVHGTASSSEVSRGTQTGAGTPGHA